jgi:hypothetical protein
MMADKIVQGKDGPKLVSDNKDAGGIMGCSQRIVNGPDGKAILVDGDGDPVTSNAPGAIRQTDSGPRYLVEANNDTDGTEHSGGDQPSASAGVRKRKQLRQKQSESV